MKSSLMLGASLVVSTVLASPFNRPRQADVITDWVFETVYVTVTGELPTVTSDSPAPTNNGEVQKAAMPTTTESSQSSVESPPPTSSDTVPTTSNQPDLGDYQRAIIDAHNSHRANHSVENLRWSDELAGIAHDIASTCVYGHEMTTGGGGYGQNIGAGSVPTEIPKMITNAMYNDEIGYYPGYGGEPNLNDFHKWGHFSQIVWKETQEVGCATIHCPGGLAKTGKGVMPYFTVCNYKPAGNFVGQYSANVLEPKGMATVHL